MSTDSLPTYGELPQLPDSTQRHVWDVWGRDDELGALNLIGPDQVRAATALVHSGRVVSLNASLTEPNPGLAPSRTVPSHVIHKTPRGLDDHLDGFFLQFSSQWDGLRHIRHTQHGFYGGRDESTIETTGALGIDRWAEHGIVTRGVLIDAAAYYADRGADYRPDGAFPLGPAEMDEILESEGVTLSPGCVLVIRTGWLEWYQAQNAETRDGLIGSIGRVPDPLQCAGLRSGEATAAWLWNHRVAAVAADNPALEVLPVNKAEGFLHYRLIPMLGMPVGEFWALGDLSRACAEAGRYEFLLFSGPLNLPNGVGSPANAYAVL